MRADTINERIVRALVTSGTTSLTVAPEVGSERMRRITNKRIDEGRMIQTMSNVAAWGIRSLTLYFLVGLPWERESDVENAGRLARRLSEAFLERAERGRVTIEVNPFIPKPRTPFQWCRLEPPDSLKKKLEVFSQACGRLRGARLSGGSVRGAVVQAILSKGDEDTGRALYRQYTQGISLLRSARLESPATIDLVFTDSPLDSRFPWSWLMPAGEEAYLRSQYLEAKRSALG